MAHFRFTLIKERVIRNLGYHARRRWLSLLRRRAELEGKYDALTAEIDAHYKHVLDGVEEHEIKAHAEGTPVELRLTEDGQIIQTCCECPRCQAELQGLPVVQVVESMISQGLIIKNHVHVARVDARIADIKKMMLN